MDPINMIEILLQIIIVMVGGLLVPYLKEKLGAEKYGRILTSAQIGVAAAEQIYKSMPKSGTKNQLRYDYVAEYLTSKGFKIDKTELEALIESAVMELNEAVK